ncbi:hypothetical protein P5663_19250 [Priestia flexa]|uniref:hypothetical protein n=1 Tax=Priestia flexa TaxID=86664 RepID=UPI00240DA21A|nr:hypothetical protein [Priestia flexa]WEZ08133.1 hypothetical protein P5663_19250 [Priestia flexa]
MNKIGFNAETDGKIETNNTGINITEQPYVELSLYESSSFIDYMRKDYPHEVFSESIFKRGVRRFHADPPEWRKQREKELAELNEIDESLKTIPAKKKKPFWKW